MEKRRHWSTGHDHDRKYFPQPAYVLLCDLTKLLRKFDRNRSKAVTPMRYHTEKQTERLTDTHTNQIISNANSLNSFIEAFLNQENVNITYISKMIFEQKYK